MVNKPSVFEPLKFYCILLISYIICFYIDNTILVSLISLSGEIRNSVGKRGGGLTTMFFFIYYELFGDFNPIALRKAKIVYNFGLSECNRVKVYKLSNK